MKTGIIAFVAFGGVSLLVVFLVSLFGRRNASTRARLRDAGFAGHGPQNWSALSQKVMAGLPSLGVSLLPRDEKERDLLSGRLRRAGLNHPQALPLLLGVKAILMLLGPGIALLGVVLDQSVVLTLLTGAAASAVGMLLPGLWLDWKSARRQALLRRGLPDVLDMMVLCLEGGLSPNGALQRVKGEIEAVHPQLAAELRVVERDMMMGLSAGDALRKMGERADLEELRSLAAVMLQSERYGASVVKALRVFADSLRNERQQQAEEKAQKAAVKILFPTLLCIFPAIFVVILGPAAFQIQGIFKHMK